MDKHLLLIEEDSNYRMELARKLREHSFLVDEAETIEEIHEKLSQRTYAIVLLNPILKQELSIESFNVIKEVSTINWVPLIINTDQDVVTASTCFEYGADDYVLRSSNFKELLARIFNRLNRADNFEEMAFHDPLTKAFNRRYFDHQIKIELQRAIRNKTSISLAFIDADKFKSVNDTYGHHVGDLVLMGLAKLIQENIRNTDIFARYGGEEFVILLPNANSEQAAQKVTGILEKIRNSPVAEHDGQKRYITFSSGVSEWIPSMTIEDWIQQADLGVYQAKTDGRNRVVCYVDTNNSQTPNEDKIKNILIFGANELFKGFEGKLSGMNFCFETLNIDNPEESVNFENVDLCIFNSDPERRILDLLKIKNIKTAFVTERNVYQLLYTLKQGYDGIFFENQSEIEIEYGLKRLVAI